MLVREVQKANEEERKNSDEGKTTDWSGVFENAFCPRCDKQVKLKWRNEMFLQPKQQQSPMHIRWSKKWEVKWSDLQL